MSNHCSVKRNPTKKVAYYCPHGCNIIKRPEGSINERCESCRALMSPNFRDDYEASQEQIINDAIARWDNREYSC